MCLSVCVCVCQSWKESDLISNFATFGGSGGLPERRDDTMEDTMLTEKYIVGEKAYVMALVF